MAIRGGRGRMRTLGDVCVGRLGRGANQFDALRLLAACLVFVSHAWCLYGRFAPTLLPPRGGSLDVTLATLGVTVFFVMSGFLIAMSWSRSDGWVPYLGKRALRLYPGLVVCMAVVILGLGALVSSLPPGVYYARILGMSGSQALHMLWFDALALPGVFEDGLFPSATNNSLWTLRVEILCYLAVAVLGSTLGLRRGLWAATAVFFAVFWGRITGPATVGDLAYFHAAAFALGSLVWVHRDRVLLDRRLFGLAVGALFVLSFLDLYWLPVYLLAVSYSVFYVAFSEGFGLDVAQNGDLSYGVYIYAWPVQQAMARWFGYRQEYFWAYFLCAFAATLLLAALSWRWVESKALELKTRLRPTAPPGVIRKGRRVPGDVRSARPDRGRAVTKG